MIHRGIFTSENCESVIFFFFFKFWFAGQFDTEFAEFPDINRRQHDRSMGLTAFEGVKLLQCQTCFRIACRADRECDQSLVCMKSWISASEIFGFEFLDRMDCLR